jgi:hypothetical protein
MVWYPVLALFLAEPGVLVLYLKMAQSVGLSLSLVADPFFRELLQEHRVQETQIAQSSHTPAVA